MKKYFIGIGIIGVVVFGLSVYIISLGVQSKQDKATYEKATDTADKLNDYIRKNRKIPDSLQQAGVDDVPDTIKYTKSDTTYTFCATYKADRGYGGSDITSVVTGAALRSYDYEYDYESDYQPSSLYVTYSYEKGENCQTVKPVGLRTSTSYGDDGLGGSSSIYDQYCGTQTLRERYETYCSYYDEEDSSF